MRNNDKLVLEGFENHVICSITDSAFCKENQKISPVRFSGGFVNWNNAVSIVLYDKDDKRLDVFRDEDMKEVFKETGDIQNAVRVYVHPCCTLSRDLVYEKYKRVLNPWKADVVVIPEPSKKMCEFTENTLLSVSSHSNKVYLCKMSEIVDYVDIVPGKTVSEVTGYKPDKYDNCHHGDWYVDAYRGACNSVIDGIYSMVEYNSGEQWVKDYIDGALPKDKIVWDSSLQKSLGCEDNKVTVESLTSILDMLKSSDSNIQTTGLCALSTMDWANYKGSVRYVLIKALDYNIRLCWNKAWNRTSVKYMKNQLKNSKSRNYPFSMLYQRSITEKDWGLLKQLIKANDDWNHSFLTYCGFLTITIEGKLTIIKDENGE